MRLDRRTALVRSSVLAHLRDRDVLAAGDRRHADRSHWPNLIIIFELTMVGGILATVVTLFITAGIPGQAAKVYDPEVADGKILVGVAEPPKSAVSGLERALGALPGTVKRVSGSRSK